MFLLGFRRKLTALALCKSIESAIQRFQIHHRITFATMQNPAVYLSGARVSIFSTLVPRLITLNVRTLTTLPIQLTVYKIFAEIFGWIHIKYLRRYLAGYTLDICGDI